MLAEKRTGRADTHPVLNANDLELAIVLLAELLREHLSPATTGSISWLRLNEG